MDDIPEWVRKASSEAIASQVIEMLGELGEALTTAGVVMPPEVQFVIPQAIGLLQAITDGE